MELHPRRCRLLLVSEFLAKRTEPAAAIVRCRRRTAAKCSATSTATAEFDALQNNRRLPAGMARCADGGDRHPW